MRQPCWSEEVALPGHIQVFMPGKRAVIQHNRIHQPRFGILCAGCGRGGMQQGGKAAMPPSSTPAESPGSCPGNTPRRNRPGLSGEPDARIFPDAVTPAYPLVRQAAPDTFCE